MKANDKTGKPEKYATAHDLRRSCGERLRNAGVPPLVICRVMRHSSWETTQKHYAPGDIQVDAEVLRKTLGAGEPPPPGALSDVDRRVLAICGDAGFMMNVQEMETAARLNSNLVAMVWEDKEYGLIAWKQTNEFGHHTDLSFNNPDWLQLASAFGWHGHHCTNSRELADTLERAFNETGPSLVVIPIDYRENVLLTKKLGEITCTI